MNRRKAFLRRVPENAEDITDSPLPVRGYAILTGRGAVRFWPGKGYSDFGILAVYLHFGNPVHPRNLPYFPFLSVSVLPHLGQTGCGEPFAPDFAASVVFGFCCCAAGMLRFGASVVTAFGCCVAEPFVIAVFVLFTGCCCAAGRLYFGVFASASAAVAFAGRMAGRSLSIPLPAVPVTSVPAPSACGRSPSSSAASITSAVHSLASFTGLHIHTLLSPIR